MAYGAKMLSAMLHRLLRIQLVLAVVIALIYYAISGGNEAVAALYGALIAAVITLLQMWQQRRIARLADTDVASNMSFLYRAAFERLATTIALFALGMGLMRLAPLPLVVGFIAGQFGLLFSGIRKQKLGR